MVVVKQITKAEFLNGYAKNDIWDIARTRVNAEMRLYGKTGLDAGDQDEGYIVVYMVE